MPIVCTSPRGSAPSGTKKWPNRRSTSSRVSNFTTSSWSNPARTQATTKMRPAWSTRGATRAIVSATPRSGSATSVSPT